MYMLVCNFVDLFSKCDSFVYYSAASRWFSGMSRQAMRIFFAVHAIDGAFSTVLP